jgi:hypothetical protein
MNDRIRISDADREQVAARLREHYAEGRLNSDELEERISATFSAKTYGDLRRVMADLPEPAPVPDYGQQWGKASRQAAQWGRPRTVVYRRGPRLLPLALLALVVALVVPGVAWLFLALFKIVLVLWLVAAVVGIIGASLFRRRMRRMWRSGGMHYWHQFD